MNNIAKAVSDCCGCGACAQVCHFGAISFKPDDEGFYAPVVDDSKCTNCSACTRVCPQINHVSANEPKEVWAAYSTSDNVLARSSSGGLFSVAGNIALSDGATVYGAVLDEKSWTVKIEPAKDEASIAKQCGSKYVQSLPIEHFSDIAKALDEGKKILFAGCPCQVAAIKSFVGKDKCENLTTIDIICHGVPSPTAFQSYIKWLTKKKKREISQYRFRTKKRGWGMTLGYRAGNREIYKACILDRYNYNFLSKNDYRECCYKCLYANSERQGDITLGDYWGVLREHPGFYSEKGVSMALVNTEKGLALFEKMKDSVDCTLSSFEQAVRHNENLARPSSRPQRRNGFYDGITTMTPELFVEKRMTVKYEPKSIVKALTPWRIKRLAQRIMLARRTK